MTSPGVEHDTLHLPDPETYLDDPRFHQSFTLPDTASLPQPFKVTYCDYGYRNPENPDLEHVVLMCGPLLGSRWLNVAKDTLAKRHRVRVLDVDRPGFGASTRLPHPGARVAAFLAVVPALLAHLGVRRLAGVVAHSGGAVYALNVLLHLRHLLRPTRPYAALLAPWVHPRRSGVSVMALAAGLPEGVVAGFDKVAGFMVGSLGPVVGFSEMTSGVVSGWFSGGGKKKKEEYEGEMVRFEEGLQDPLVARVYAEDVSGLGQEAVLLLKKGACAAGAWGGWEDHDEYVARLAEEVRREGERLRVDVFFAESDGMIGTGAGPGWFSECWGEERRGDGIAYRSCVVPGTDHDSIVGLKFGVHERIFRAVAGEDEEGEVGSGVPGEPAVQVGAVSV
ncbi:hypothetical protein C8035_v006734 [Colletotrichum spinosum]|uniref:AB hydrolase-1 domain-containing protein n=1 Tax=Colletotrichum spinosum TaxID=1347390 RepID=A0A4R8PLP0_9PEZI|nr:hypothetical protein C8035_v006734 [Colletotrichum spinosum]